MDKSNIAVKGIILYIFLILFIISFSRVVSGANEFTFTTFLNFMTTVPDLTLPTNVINLSIGGSWGVFEFFRTFINSWISIINFFLFYASLALNNLIVILWFLGFVFGYAA